MLMVHLAGAGQEDYGMYTPVMSGGYNLKGDIMIIVDQPLPCSILSIEADMVENAKL